MLTVNTDDRLFLGESLAAEKYWIKSGDKKEIVKMVVFMSFYCFVQYLPI